MVHLGDFLGHLLSEITIARMKADIETLRIGEFYASDELLKNMPVPRFRLPDVEIDVPVLMSGMEDAPPEEPVRPEKLREEFDAVLTAELKSKNIRLNPRDKTRIGEIAGDVIATLAPSPGVPMNTGRAADLMSSRAVEVITASQPNLAESEKRDLADRLKVLTRVSFLRLQKPPARLSVLATTQEIKEAAASENVVRFRIKISEDSLIWTTIESDQGDARNRLLPE